VAVAAVNDAQWLMIPRAATDASIALEGSFRRPTSMATNLTFALAEDVARRTAR